MNQRKRNIINLSMKGKIKMGTNNDEKINTSKSVTRKLIFENILNLEFVVSVIIPIILFSAFDHYRMTLEATIISGSWSILVMLILFIKNRKINIFAASGTGFSVIGLIGTIISKDPVYYLASPIVIDLLLAVVFLGSVTIGRPIIQVLAEYTVKGGFSEELRKKPEYKSAWIIVTTLWGILNITQALLRIILLYSVSKEIYYAVSTAYGSISSPLLLLFSFWFPGWYWRRKA